MMQTHKNSRGGNDPARILMLVPHEPDADPRIEWVKQLCLEIGPTDVIGLGERSILGDKPRREYDGKVYVERIDVVEFASMGAKWLYLLARALNVGGAIRRYIRRESERRSAPSFKDSSNPESSDKPSKVTSHFASPLRLWSAFKAMIAAVDHRIGSACRFFSNLASYGLIVSALYRRGRAASISPRIIVCHDIFALASAVMLKRVFRCPIIYDSHELWPEADLIAQEWEKRLTAWIEGRLVKHADVVVTVSPPLARHLERLYGLAHVVSAPNAEPIRSSVRRQGEGSASKPVKFLLQGRVSPRRGIEELFEGWSSIQKSDAVLYLRCPQNEYLFELRRKFHRMIENGNIVLLQAVREEDLVGAAAFADVGVIPYWNMGLIHQYCCPNKLSQYMQAGLALLSNNLDYVSGVVSQYQCGIVYDAAHSESLRETVSRLANNLDELKRMKENAFRASQSEFHWEAQSAEYRDAVKRLYAQGKDAASSHGAEFARHYA